MGARVTREFGEPAGVRELRWRPQRSLVGIALILVLAASACMETHHDRPARLLDGSAIPGPSITLDRIGDAAVMTRVTTVNASRLVSGSPAASCVGKEHDRDAAGPVVRRVGVTGESVTFRSSSGLAILACDDSGGRREDERRWCGGALGRLERGRLSDPRLDLAGCVSAAGEPLAFAWMEPGRGTSFVAVRQDGFVEVYRAAGGLPVRVTSTTGIDLQRSSASFEISEHDANGRLIRAYTLEAQVAG